MTQQEANKEAIRVFLSYSQEDKKFVERMRNILTHRPDVQLFQPEMLTAGEDWRGRLREELLNCNLFMILLSPDSVNSEWVLSELGAAWAVDKPIIAATTEPEASYSLPVSAQGIRYFELQELEKPEVLNRIITGYEE
jgi:hypothetical protein